MEVVFAETVTNYETVSYSSWVDRGWKLTMADQVFVNWSYKDLRRN